MSETHLHLDPTTPAQNSGCGCGCGTSADVSSAQTADPHTGITTTFQVVGMTCGHCVNSVTSELTDSVPGVSDVQIDLPTGRVVLTSDRPVAESAVAAAVEEAGYQLAPASVH